MTKGHRFFAFFWARVHGVFNPLRKALVSNVRGRVLELGAGLGETLPYYSGLESLVLLEPDPCMRIALTEKLDGWSFPIEVCEAPAEHLPFGDVEFDVVVCSLVLCSVEDPRQVFSEIHRVLKPNGKLYFLEHVRSANLLLAKLQDWWTPMQVRMAAGCHPNRETIPWLIESGFQLLEVERVKKLGPIYRGIAVKSC